MRWQKFVQYIYVMPWMFYFGGKCTSTSPQPAFNNALTRSQPYVPQTAPNQTSNSPQPALKQPSNSHGFLDIHLSGFDFCSKGSFSQDHRRLRFLGNSWRYQFCPLLAKPMLMAIYCFSFISSTLSR